jgi:hypothetical protein
MTTLSHSLLKARAPRPDDTIDRHDVAPANGFSHNGKLNMGPAIWLAVSLSLIGWAGAILGLQYVIRHVI